jgi:flagellar biosynthesis chaperone FliJ
LEECSCTNENQAKDLANSYIIKMKPNLNDEKIDEKSIEDFSGLQQFQPNIFADVKAATSAPPILDGGIPTQTNEGKYVCLCKKSYSHRSSYYKHTSTCLQFQHRQSVNKLTGIPHQDSSMNTVSVSIISTTTTTTTTTATMTVPLAVRELVPVAVLDRIEQPIASSGVVGCVGDDDPTEIVRYRFKSKKKVGKMDEPIDNVIFHYSNCIEPELSVQISENSENDEHASSSLSGSSSSSSSIMSDDDDDTDDDTVSAMSAMTAGTDAASSVVSELLTEQNEKLKDYIRKMISALTIGKKRNKKSLVNSLVFELLDQNKTLQKQIVELSKERNIIVNNTNNNQFNLNFFLNEQCKDAVNISDFVNSLEITMDDLTYTRNQGLVEGISKVMIDGLKQMDLYKRPIHCTDQKRDTIYVRDNHQWARDEGNARMRQAFIDIANKEYFAVKKWMDLHPGWETNSRLQEFHHKMIRNVLHEIKDDPIGERKIMKSVEREVFIEK